MSFRFYGEPQEDKRLRRMIVISAVLHVGAIGWIMGGAFLNRSPHPRAVAYTVELVNPAAVGTNLPGGAKPLPPPQSKPETKPQPQVAKKEEPKPPSPVQRKEAVKIPEKDQPVEKPTVKPEKAQIAEKKPETRKVEPKPEPLKAAKAEEQKPEAKKSVAKPESENVDPKKVEEKKPEPQKIVAKPQTAEVKPEKTEAQVEKAETKPEPDSPPAKAPEEKPAKTDLASPEERDRQIAAALDRIKAQVRPKEDPEFSEGAKGTGPVTKGGEVGEGGGGTVRGLEFIVYTQQLQRRVQESWIVAEKKPGLVAAVSFKIQPDGDVQEMELIRSSGDNVFDQSVVRAIRRAAPFPPPPQSYAQEFATQKIVMNFGGEGRVN